MDRTLVERARKGDHAAFATLAEAATGRLYGVATLILRDPDRAQDAVQERSSQPGETSAPCVIPTPGRRGSIASSSGRATGRPIDIVVVGCSVTRSTRPRRPSATGPATLPIATRSSAASGGSPSSSARSSSCTSTSGCRLPRPASSSGFPRARPGPGCTGRSARCARRSRPMPEQSSSTPDDQHERDPRPRTRPDPVDGGRRAHTSARPCRPGDRRPNPCDAAASALARPPSGASDADPAFPRACARLRPIRAAQSSPSCSSLALLAGVVYVGSQLLDQRSLPPPFGVAGNGLIAVEVDGAIVTMNPDGSNMRTLELPFEGLSAHRLLAGRDPVRRLGDTGDDPTGPFDRALIVANADGSSAFEVGTERRWPRIGRATIALVARRQAPGLLGRCRQAVRRRHRGRSSPRGSRRTRRSAPPRPGLGARRTPRLSLPGRATATSTCVS